MSQLLCHEYSLWQRTLPPSPTRSESQSACQAAFYTTQFKQSAVTRQRNQTKKWSWRVIKRAAHPARFAPSCERAGFSGIARKGGTCCETRQVHPLCHPVLFLLHKATAVAFKMILIKRGTGVKDRSALPSGLARQMERFRNSFDFSRLDPKKFKEATRSFQTSGRKWLLIWFRIPHQFQRAGHFSSASHLYRCMRNVNLLSITLERTNQTPASLATGLSHLLATVALHHHPVGSQDAPQGWICLLPEPFGNKMKKQNKTCSPDFFWFFFKCENTFQKKKKKNFLYSSCCACLISSNHFLFFLPLGNLSY